MVPARAVVVYVWSQCVALAVVVYPGEPLAQEAVLLLGRAADVDRGAFLRNGMFPGQATYSSGTGAWSFSAIGLQCSLVIGYSLPQRCGSEAASMMQAETRETRQAEWRAMLRRLRVTQDEIAERLQIGRSAVSNVVRYGEVPEYWWYLAMEIARERIAALPEEAAS